MRFSVAAILCVFVAGVAATAPVEGKSSHIESSCPGERQCYSQCYRMCKGDDNCYNGCTIGCGCNW
ncbi:hypothetical protein BC828DRAFT_383693 [Blastocladiella britannica]|nr:hypothetical protein BC828DRAFT_383693 [Blastocladiella britannica]